MSVACSYIEKLQRTQAVHLIHLPHGKINYVSFPNNPPNDSGNVAPPGYSELLNPHTNTDKTPSRNKAQIAVGMFRCGKAQKREKDFKCADKCSTT